MPTQQLVYALGLFNLTLAGIAVFCVTEAENRPEHFVLVYVAISIFVFYMGTILVIIALQIIETYQERRSQHATLLEISMPVLKTTIISQANAIVAESATVPMKRIAISLTPSSLNSESASSDMVGHSPSLTLLPKPQETIGANDENDELHPLKSTGVN